MCLEGLLVLGCFCDGSVDRVRRISVWRRGIKPGSMAVPPVTRIDEAIVFRRSRGT